MILKKYKNKIYQVVKDSNIDLKIIKKEEATDDYRDYFSLSYDDSMKFSVRNTLDSFFKFEFKYTKFEKNYPETEWLPKGYYAGIELVLEELNNWINTELKDYASEFEELDYWDKAEDNLEYLDYEYIDFEDQKEFTLEEKEQVKVGLNEVQLTINSKLKLDEHQKQLVERRIKYLEEAIERNNKTDWKSIAISTFLGLIMNLGVDTNTGKLIWQIVQSIFSNIPSLPLP